MSLPLNDVSLFEELSKGKLIEVLRITVGFRHIIDFEYLHIVEIDNLIKVNTIVGIKIIYCFLNGIKLMYINLT